MKRRSFVQQSGIIGAGISLGQGVRWSGPNDKLNVGFIGCGMRGMGHISLISERNDCNIVALADPDLGMINRSLAYVKEKLGYKPESYTDGDRDYLNMLEKESLDLVIISTPWRWHTEMAVACLEKNIYTGLEVSGGINMEECWAIVKAEKLSRAHLYFMENVCFRRDVLSVLNMVRDGLFGELIHLECGYQHDLREVKFNDGKQAYGGGVEFGENGYSESKWRTAHSIHRNGDLYPTHGIGPIAQYININKGNRFLYISSVASKSRGLHDYIINHPMGGPEHPNADIEFKLGDKVTSIIKCQNGETIVVHHDTSLPRPYSLGFRVQGTKGLWMDVNKSIYIEGVSEPHRWEDQTRLMNEYDHVLWKRMEKQAAGAGHGGMDYFLINSLVEHAKRNDKAPFDAIDAASWKAITPLSEKSIQENGQPQKFPDFSEGGWETAKNEFAQNGEY